MDLFDDRRCLLGEGPLWHPERQQMFWFDILGKKLLTLVGEEQKSWIFEEHVSAAGWVDNERLLIASETALFLFHLETGERQDVCSLEADNDLTRSNDGRADPHGGFWIGTMGKQAEDGVGSIYRFFKGELRLLYGDISITNAICFAPNGKLAYFTDTTTQKVMQVALDEDGWPNEEPVLFVDVEQDNLNPDGAVVDASGNVWIAFWGVGQVRAYSPQGSLLRTEVFEATQTSCPGFGGADLKTLFVTTAAVDLSVVELADQPHAGAIFARDIGVKGQPENRINL